MKFRRKRRSMALLNITSLIDVVFMLLIFFMLTIDFSRFRMIGVDTPQQLEVVKDPTAAIVILLRKDGGFEYDGRHWRSLTAIAKAITGTHWNGYRFFGLSGGKQ